MKKAKLAVLPYRHHPKYHFVLDLRAFGEGRKFFKTKAEAQAEQKRQRTLLEMHSRQAIGLSPADMSEIIKGRNKLAEYNKTLTDAVNHYIHHLERIRRCRVTVAQLADEVVAAKRRDGMSAVYISNLKLRLDHFRRDFGNRIIADITVEELDNWLRDLPQSPKSRLNYRTNIGVMFSFAVSRRMLDSNPVSFTAKPKLIDAPPEIFKLQELSALLDAAQHVEPEILPMLAIGAFAGLRDAEIKRLHWNEILFDRNWIEVKAEKAKSARRRLVPIQPNLAAWLEPYREMHGRVVPQNPRRKLENARKAAGLTTWPTNGLRHSYASYRLAVTADAPRVSSELGQTTPQMLYAAYRELVSPEEAERYWKIEPAVEAPEPENLVAFTAAPQ